MCALRLGILLCSLLPFFLCVFVLFLQNQALVQRAGESLVVMGYFSTIVSSATGNNIVKKILLKAQMKRYRVVVTRFIIWSVAVMLSFVLLPLLPSTEAYILPAQRSCFSCRSSRGNSCSSNSALGYICKGTIEGMVYSYAKREVGEYMHKGKVPSMGRRKVALSMSTSAPIPTSSSSIDKERWRRRRYIMTTFFMHAITWPLYASFKLLEMGLVTGLKLFNVLLSLPLMSLIGKPIKQKVQDLFDLKLPMLKYLWPRDRGFFSQEFRSKLFLLASFSMMFLGERILQ